MKSIVLAEKPSVAKDLARVLQCNKKNKSFFEGSKYIVTWALGHLVTLATPEEYDQRYREWKMEDLPLLPDRMKLTVIRKTSHQFNAIKNLLKRSDVSECIIATDAGREGELVARWILKLSGFKKDIRRLWISSQTNEAIKDGFANLKDGKNYQKLYDAAVCRAEADWVVGLNITRALTCKYSAQLNAGRVQTPTMYMIVNREQEIQNFEPQDYWVLQARFDDYFGTWRNSQGNIRIYDSAKAHEIAGKVQKKTGTIEKVSLKSKSEPPPLAYDLTELQRDANRFYGFSAKKTLSVIQILYERFKVVTYPRTDSRYITQDMVKTLPRRVEAISGNYKKLVAPLLNKQLNPGGRFVNDSKVSDHHAIIPTEESIDINKFNNDERKIYDLIARRFIAVLYPNYKYDQMTITTLVEGERFYSKGKVVKELGWREVTQKEAESNNEDVLPEQTLQQKQQGQKVEVVRCDTEKHKTSPPARYTEATLLTAMEGAGKFIEDEELRESIKQGGLGTPATRADIIEKLIDNMYIERRGNSLAPTSKAKQLVELVPEDLRSPELTAKWELRLSNIAQGTENGKKFMEDIRHKTKALLTTIQEDTSTYKADNVSKHKCPICKEEFMLLSKGKKGNTLVCPSRECGHRQPEKMEDLHSGRRRRGESAVNKKLIAQYSDQGNIGTSLGDLLKDALKSKEKK